SVKPGVLSATSMRSATTLSCALLMKPAYLNSQSSGQRWDKIVRFLKPTKPWPTAQRPSTFQPHKKPFQIMNCVTSAYLELTYRPNSKSATVKFKSAFLNYPVPSLTTYWMPPKLGPSTLLTSKT